MDESAKITLLTAFLFFIVIYSFEEVMFLVQDAFAKPKLRLLMKKQYSSINKEFEKFKVSESAKTPVKKTLRGEGFQRNYMTRKKLHLKFIKKDMKDWRKQFTPSEMLGHGEYGTTFTSCVGSEDNCTYVVKSSRSFNLKKGEFQDPTEMGKHLLVNELFALLDIADDRELRKSVPKIYDYFSEVGEDGKRTFFIVMDKFEECYKVPSAFDKFLARRGFGEWQSELKTMEKALKDLVEKFNDYGWIHLDIHEGNILCDSENPKKYILIDWGLSFCVEDELDETHPVPIHYAKQQQGEVSREEIQESLSVSDMKDIQQTILNNWYKIVMEHSTFGSLRQERRRS